MDKLDYYLDAVRNRDFEWGEHDCALFASKATDAHRGTSWTQFVRALNCRSAKDYRDICRNGSLRALTSEYLGEPSQGEPERGDVVLLRSGPRAMLGIAVPPLVLAAGPHGTVPLGSDHIVCFWRTK